MTTHIWLALQHCLCPNTNQNTLCHSSLRNNTRSIIIPQVSTNSSYFKWAGTSQSHRICLILSLLSCRLSMNRWGAADTGTGNTWLLDEKRRKQGLCCTSNGERMVRLQCALDRWLQWEMDGVDQRRTLGKAITRISMTIGLWRSSKLVTPRYGDKSFGIVYSRVRQTCFWHIRRYPRTRFGCGQNVQCWENDHSWHVLLIHVRIVNVYSTPKPVSERGKAGSCRKTGDTRYQVGAMEHGAPWCKSVTMKHGIGAYNVE